MLTLMTIAARRVLVLPAVTAALLGAALAVSPAGASAGANCPAKRGTIAKKPLGRVWHHKHSLWACTTVYGLRPRSVRLGPWAPGAHVAWDGVSAAWTVPLTRNGVQSDRGWAASAESGARWLTGTRLVPATAQTPAREARVQSIVLVDEGAAWVTRHSDVVFVLHDPQDGPAAVGTLPATLTPTGHLLLVGSWPDTPAATLAATAKLTEGAGDGDECGGVNPYTLLVTPDPSAPPAGAAWSGGWERAHCG